MEDLFCIKKGLMEHMIAAIDSRIAVFYCSKENKYVSDKLFEILGFDQEKSTYYLQNADKLISFFEAESAETTHDNSECIHKIGIIDIDERYIIIHLFKTDDEDFGFIVDKTAQVNKNVGAISEIAKLKRNSQIDGLTGVLNRSGFEKTVERSLKLRQNKSVLCIMDMDNFKLVNDTLGHPAGDSVLKKIADMLNDTFSLSAFVGRIGGDEFAVFIYEEMTYDKLSESLEAFENKVKADFAKEYPDKKLSVSIGAAMTDSGINDYVSLYKSADAALYKVKEKGKGSYAIV